MQKAMMAKEVSKVMSNPGSIWSRVLTNKEKLSNKMWEWQLKGGCSWGWRATGYGGG